jgi:DNA-directed RNA polymerase specialized sigma24 family protein
MWPDDYIVWAARIRSFVAHWIKRHLNRHLHTNPQWTDEVVDALAEQATRHTFDVANDHRRYPDYCRTETEFRVWVCTVGLNEALRLLIRHRFSQSRLALLSADQCRWLVMRYVDQLVPGDIAGVLRVSPDVVRERTYQALDALFQTLGQPDVETE